MTHRSWRSFLLCAPALVIGSLQLKPQAISIPDPCLRTAEMQVYSDVFFHKETGDLLGYELAIKRLGDSAAEALLFVYEGGEADDGIPLSGQVSKNRLTLKGTWVDHLIEYPSKREVVRKQTVEITGTVAASTFRGELTISGMGDHQHVQLRHVKRIWPCNKRNAKP